MRSTPIEGYVTAQRKDEMKAKAESLGISLSEAMDRAFEMWLRSKPRY